MKNTSRAYQRGRKERLANEVVVIAGSQVPLSPRLYSHNATWRGWYSVTEWDIYHASHKDSRSGLERAKALFREQRYDLA